MARLLSTVKSYRRLVQWAPLAAVVVALAGSASAQPRVKAPQVEQVKCAAGGRHKSTFTRRPDGRWVERTADRKSFEWTERNRDEWSLYLYDPSRRFSLQIDLHRREVFLEIPGRPRGTLCRVTGVKARDRRPPPRPAPPRPRPAPPPPRPAPPPPRPGPDEASDEVRVPGITEAQTRRLVSWAVEEAGRLEQPACWKVSRPNTAGKPLTTCGRGEDKDGALCYPKCRSGYVGRGPVCWQTCPSRFRDTGGHCLKPKAYGRGAGYPWKIGDKIGSLRAARKRCKRDHGKCEKHGAIIYPKCKSGFSPIGCCTCSPKCPSGMTDIGVSCQKKSYGRGAGRPLGCRSDQVRKGALCYPKCPRGWDHGGPVCWKGCESGHPTNCGAMCGKSASVCALEVSNMVLSSAELAANIAGAALTGGAANAGMQAAKQAAKQGSKLAAKAALKKAVRAAGRKVAGKLRRRLGARVTAYATKKSGRRAGQKLAQDYAEMVAQRAAEKIALAAANQDPSLREIVSMVDPTGVAEVVNAFDKPLCRPTPMPR